MSPYTSWEHSGSKHRTHLLSILVINSIVNPVPPIKIRLRVLSPVQNSEYPLVTHDPNMLKNKSRGNLVGKIKVSLPEGKYENFRQKQFVQYQVLHKLCSIPDQLGPISRLIDF